MSECSSPSSGMDPCGCCAGVTRRTPFKVSNQPGLSVIGYRVGRHPCFKQSMLAGLSGRDCPTLRDRLNTRADDDFAIALLDSAAVLADILTFYQERIANESYLRTATERFSVLQLARLVGYQLSPGVAAGTYLAFTLEEAAGAPDRVALAVGTKAQSVPGQDEQAQIFETITEIIAERRYNRLRVYPQALPAAVAPKGLDRVLVSGDTSGLAQGDNLVAFAAGTGKVEDKKVKALKVAGPVAELVWEPGLQQGFPVGSRLRKWARKYRLFGHNLPAKTYGPDGDGKVVEQTVTPGDGYLNGGLPLDGLHDDFKAGQQVLVFLPGNAVLASITAVSQGGVSVNPSFSAAVTRIALDLMPSVDTSDLTDVRSAVVYQLAEPTGDDWQFHGPVIPAGTSAVCVQPVDLPKGRQVAFTDGTGASHIAQVTKCTPVDSRTLVEFEPALSCPLDTLSAEMLANVVPATHGETVSEVLGSGDASRAHQRFTLRQPPLTYVGAAGAGGAKSTLEVRVNDQLWAEVSTLYGCGPDEHVYTTRTEDDGSTVLQFGDGKTGARLPSGRENIRARYRKGIGSGGMVRSGQVSLLMTRPLGLKAVVNPAPAADAADQEPIENARHSAPLKVLTLDRAVSLQDYEDFALAFAGIAKAFGTWTWDGEQRSVFITVAGPGGTRPSDDKCRELVAALHQAGDPHVKVRVEPCRLVSFQLAAAVKVQPDRAGEEEEVLAAVREAAGLVFSFEARSIGQAVTLSEVVATLQAAAGVQAVDVDLLYRSDDAQGLKDRLVAAFPQTGERDIPVPAELLTIDAEQMILKVMT